MKQTLAPLTKDDTMDFDAARLESMATVTPEILFRHIFGTRLDHYRFGANEKLKLVYQYLQTIEHERDTARAGLRRMRKEIERLRPMTLL
jgi:hypothetical protein